jgi:S1-C subfamily serine protease
VIVAVAGRNVTNVAQLLSAVAALKPGTPAKLDVLRKDGKSSVDITPGKRTPPPRPVE